MTQNRVDGSVAEKFESSSPHHSDNLGSRLNGTRSQKRTENDAPCPGDSGVTRRLAVRKKKPKRQTLYDVARQQSRERREAYERTGILDVGAFPPAFDSIASYVAELRSVRDALEAAKAGPTGHFVYIVMFKRHESGDPIKIGYSRNPERRLDGIQVGSPRPLTLVRKFECPHQNFDKRIHRLFPRRSRALGEWFKLTDWTMWIVESIGLAGLEGELSPPPNDLLTYRDPRTGGKPVDAQTIRSLVWDAAMESEAK